MIPEAKIAEIRERADIVEVIGEHVKLTKAGANHKGVCPFHADTDPSFNVNGARQFFHCFGCSASGDVFTFVQRIDGLDFTEAAERLARRYGVTLPEREMSPAARTAQERARQAARRRRFVLEEATAFFERALASRAGEPARRALKARDINRETAAAFRLGYAPDSWSALLDHLGSKGVSPRELSEVGLALPRRSGDGFYDRFRHRLMFTVTDPSGRPIAFSGRALEDGDREQGAKYINSPETPEFTKGKVLYGLHQARVALSKQGEAVLVEGNFDVVSLARAGFENVVAPLGTALTPDQAALLRRRVERVVVLFDGDRAGRAAAARAFPILAAAGLAAYTAPLPEGEDPDSLVRSGGTEALSGLLERRQGLLDAIVGETAAGCDGSAQDVARRIERLGPLLGAVRSSMERDLYRQRVADAFGVDVRSVFRHLRGGGPEGDGPVGGPRDGDELPGRTEERELIGLLLDQPAVFDEVLEDGTLGLLVTPALRRIADELALRYRRKESLVSDMMDDANADAAVRWLARRALDRQYEEGEEEKARSALREVRDALGKYHAEQRIREIEKQIHLANSAGDEMRVLELVRQKTAIQRELHGVTA